MFTGSQLIQYTLGYGQMGPDERRVDGQDPGRVHRWHREQDNASQEEECRPEGNRHCLVAVERTLKKYPRMI